MTRALARWRACEPVRLYMYGVLVPLASLLVLVGVLSAEAAMAGLGVAAAVLGVPAIEAARARVTPWQG